MNIFNDKATSPLKKPCIDRTVHFICFMKRCILQLLRM